MSYWKNKEERALAAENHTKEMDERFANEIRYAKENTTIYSFKPNIAEYPEVDTMEVKLDPIDSVEAIMKYTEGRTAVLNFASYKQAGGGFLAGSSAQEESLCHESYLFNILADFSKYYEWNREHLNEGLYTNRALYTPEVRFERKGQIKYCDVITCAAPNLSYAIKGNHANVIADNHFILEDRIKFILDIAAAQRVDTLILGAFGCGVFKQDALEVARIFTKYLKTTHKCFHKIIFAIPADIDYHNYMKFYKTLGE